MNRLAKSNLIQCGLSLNKSYIERGMAASDWGGQIGNGVEVVVSGKKLGFISFNSTYRAQCALSLHT
jgi:hypothetical protein